MSDDIGKILENWDYRLGRVDARRVSGDDGSEKLQMRIDLGLRTNRRRHGLGNPGTYFGAKRLLLWGER